MVCNADWQPQAYDQFAVQRLRPARDLLAQVGALPAGDVVDLGCGSGLAAADLKVRFGDRCLIGVDQSASMLQQAGQRGLYDRLDQSDITLWSPHEAPALIFSNAVLHWLDDHAALLPRLAQMLVPGGVLAVQVPHQSAAPSHRAWIDLAGVDSPAMPGVLSLQVYAQILQPLGDVDLWQTEYAQILPPGDQEGHPVRLFTQTTYARPILTRLSQAKQDALCAAYDRQMARAYPLRADGSVLFPFRRLFFVLRRPT